MRRIVALMVVAGAAQPAFAREPARLVLATPVPRVPLAAARAAADRLMPLPAMTDPSFRIDDPRGQLRTGFGGTLVDFYPDGDTGFHLSAGGRLHGRSARVPLAEAGQAMAGPRGTGWRAGRRFAPAMLVGYDRAAARDLQLGVDAGVVMGRIDGGQGRFVRPPHERGVRGPNGVARMTMKLRF